MIFIEEEYPYSFENETNPVLHYFYEILLEKGHTDVRLKWNHLYYDAHSLVLKSYSGFFKERFRDILTTRMKRLLNYGHQYDGENPEEIDEQNEDKPIVIELDTNLIDTRQTMEDILKYFYINRILITTDNVESICIAAHYLKIDNLLEECEQYISSRVDRTTVLPFIKLAIDTNLTDLLHVAICSLMEDFGKIFKIQPEFLKLPFNYYERIIYECKKKNHNVEFRKQLFFNIIKWIEYDFARRERYLPHLLGLLPAHELPARFLLSKVRKHKLIKNSNLCTTLLIEALENLSKNHQIVLDNRIKNIPKTQLYCIGGQTVKGRTLSVISFYHPIKNKWKIVSKLAFEKVHFGAAAIDKKIYIVGGNNSQYARLKTLEMFDTARNVSRLLKPLPEERNYCSAASLNGILYVAGGANNEQSRLKTFLAYDPMNDDWHDLKPMIMHRINPVLITLNNRIYAIGGGTTTTEYYSLTTNDWCLSALMNSDYGFFSATVHNGKIYVCGKDSFEEYCPEEDRWSLLPPPINGFGSSLVSFNEKLLLIGGCIDTEAYTPEKAIYQYQFDNKRWKRSPVSMDHSRMHHFSVVVPQ